MKRSFLATAVLAAFVIGSMPQDAFAQRTRNPGGGGGGSSSGGSSGGGGSIGIASPRGGSSSGSGGTVRSQPSRPAGRRPSGGAVDSGSGPSRVSPGYSRPRTGVVTGRAVPRSSIGTLPPIIAGPVYWGPDNWYFYPWGFSGLGLGYFWDPWMWSGYMSTWAGYPYNDPWGGGGYYGGGYYGGGGGYYSGRDRDDDEARADEMVARERNPLDRFGPHGGLRLKVSPREADVFVDGFYAGKVDDFDGAMQKLKVAAGTHKVELKAPGYQPATFDIVILEGETTTYKTSLQKD